MAVLGGSNLPAFSAGSQELEPCSFRGTTSLAVTSPVPFTGTHSPPSRAEGLAPGEQADGRRSCWSSPSRLGPRLPAAATSVCWVLGFSYCVFLPSSLPCSQGLELGQQTCSDQGGGPGAEEAVPAAGWTWLPSVWTPTRAAHGEPQPKTELEAPLWRSARWEGAVREVGAEWAGATGQGGKTPWGGRTPRHLPSPAQTPARGCPGGRRLQCAQGPGGGAQQRRVRPLVGPVPLWPGRALSRGWSTASALCGEG